jgi:hypothetical protein
MDVFASKYGLLGLFHHLHSAPILPKHKVYVAPEAVIENGRLRMVDPATEGLELVAKAVNDGRPPTAPRFIKEYYVSVAMPKEVRFATKDWYRIPDDPSGRPLTGEDESWEEVRASYDALFVLDLTRRTKSSVLVRKESTFPWQSLLEDFPAPPYTEECLPSLARIFDDWLADTSPKFSVGENGKLSRSWRCSTLLQAMYLMLFEDLIGGARLRECDSRDCSNYYRLGPQTTTRYCSEKHTSRASTRRNRGQEP